MLEPVPVGGRGQGSLCAGSGQAFAQDRPGRLNVAVRLADNTLKGRPVMVSAIGDGKVVTQYEVLLVEPPGDAHTILDSLPAGQYDVRVEGDGLVTEVKRGVQVFSGRDGSLIAVVRPGQGDHIVEYATGGLAREEVAARIRSSHHHHDRSRAFLRNGNQRIGTPSAWKSDP